MNKLLTATVSWQRPELCKKMINSFLKTRKFADLFIYICDDDPKLEGYKEVIKEFPEVLFEIGPHLYIAEVSNHMSNIYDYEYYQMVNDDHEFIGEGWDEDMIKGCDEYNGWRIAASYMPEELMKPGPGCNFTPINAPTAEIFSRKIIKTIGFYNFPGFKQYGCDKYIMDLGQDLGGIIPFSGKILHNTWHGLNRMEPDETSKFIYSEDNQKQGMGIIYKWDRERRMIVEKIMEAKENERQKNA